MTWLLVVITVAGPIVHGEYATDDECYSAARAYVEIVKRERTKEGIPLPMATCVGVPDGIPEPADGTRIP